MGCGKREGKSYGAKQRVYSQNSSCRVLLCFRKGYSGAWQGWYVQCLTSRCNCAWHWVILCMLKCYAWQIYMELLCTSSSKSCIFFIVSFKYENWYQRWSFYLLSVQSYVLIHILLSLKRVTRIEMQFLRVMEPLKGYQVLENDYPLPRVSISINFYRLMYLLLLISRLA